METMPKDTPCKQGHPMQCGAKTRSGAPCKGKAMANARCRMHGGASVSGVASATFKHGRYSKDLPARLGERYAAALADDRLTELRDEIAILDTRLSELMTRIDTGESGALWKSLKSVWAEYWKETDTKKQAALLIALNDLIDKGLTDSANWSEIIAAIEMRRKVVESERKRLVEMQQTVTSEQLMVLVAAMVDIVRRHVSDRDALAGIASDIRGSILGRTSAQA